MRKSIDLSRVRAVIEDSLSVTLQGVQSAGIVSADVRKVSLSSSQLRQIAADLEGEGRAEIGLTAEVELFLRISNTDVLSAIERITFCVGLSVCEDDFRALARTVHEWDVAWERGLQPIKLSVLDGICRDVREMDETLTEDSYAFKAAHILLASEFVGPYVDRVATFLDYSPSFVQVIAARLQEANIWEGDEVRCEPWFDPQKGAAAFLLDLMVAEGSLARIWSMEKGQYTYHEAAAQPISRFTA